MKDRKAHGLMAFLRGKNQPLPKMQKLLVGLALHDLRKENQRTKVLSKDLLSIHRRNNRGLGN